MTNVLWYTVKLQRVHVNGCPRIPRVTFDCGVERIDLQVYAANFMHHAWPFSSFSRKFPATRAKIPAWSLRVPRKIHASSEALLRGKIEIFTQDTWKLDLSRRWYCTSVVVYCMFKFKIGNLSFKIYSSWMYECWIHIWGYMSLVTRKPVFGVSDPVRLKPACSATDTS